MKDKIVYGAKQYFPRFFGAVSLMALGAVVGALLMYFKDRDAPPQSFYEYYGTVTAEAEFVYPDLIELYSFGRSDEPLDLHIVNQLMCAPIDSGERKRLVATKITEVEGFKFTNKIPDISTRAITELSSISQLGMMDVDTIRTLQEKDASYVSWDMGNIIPAEDSDCYVTSEVTGWSHLFRFEKKIHFNGNEFSYIVDRTDS